MHSFPVNLQACYMIFGTLIRTSFALLHWFGNHTGLLNGKYVLLELIRISKIGEKIQGLIPAAPHVFQ